MQVDSPKKDESGLKRKTDNDGEMYSKNIRVSITLFAYKVMSYPFLPSVTSLQNAFSMEVEWGSIYAWKIAIHLIQ